MRGGDESVRILDPVQELDQEVAPARRVAEQRAHFGQRLRIDLAPLRAPALLARVRRQSFEVSMTALFIGRPFPSCCSANMRAQIA